MCFDVLGSEISKVLIGNGGSMVVRRRVFLRGHDEILRNSV